jgi:AcrR family transcriptional regulator
MFTQGETNPSLPAESQEEPRWRRRPDERPGEILEAALTVLLERGYSGSRMEDIARRAGVSKGTLYVYFPTKADLVRALVAQAPDELTVRFNEVRRADAARNRLRQLTEIIWQVVSEPHVTSVYRVLTAAPKELAETANTYVRELTWRSNQAAAEIIAAGIDEGIFSPCNPAEAARMIVALVLQHVPWYRDPVLWASSGLRDRRDVLDRIEAFYMAALSPPGV